MHGSEVCTVENCADARSFLLGTEEMHLYLGDVGDVRVLHVCVGNACDPGRNLVLHLITVSALIKLCFGSSVQDTDDCREMAKTAARASCGMRMTAVKRRKTVTRASHGM